MGQILTALGPTWLAGFGINLVILFILAAVAKGTWPNFRPSVGLIVVASLLWTLHGASNTILGIKQGERLGEARAAANAQAQSQAQANRTPEQLRSDFINTVDAITAQPQNLTPENKAALFRQFASIFPRGDQDRLDYARNIMIAYQCQLAVFEDALASLKAKKVTKGQLQGQCEQASGAFFGRQALIPPEVAKNNQELIEKLAKGKTEKGLPTEENLKAAFEQQSKRIETLQKLFQ